MAAITWAHVLDHAPHLSTIDADARTDILAHVNTYLTVAYFGGEEASKTKLARVYLACHFGQLLLSGASGAAGPVTSRSLGDMSEGYTSPWGHASALSETAYGKAYENLARGTYARAGLLL